MADATQAQIGAAQKPAATNSALFAKFLLMQQFEARQIGERIRQARKERGMTQEQLAEVASFSSRSLTDYETGVTIPYRHLREIGRLLGREPEWFLHGDTVGERDEETSAELREIKQLLAELVSRLEPQTNNGRKDE